MQKEKSVKSYTRRTKSGKTVVVHAYKAKYDAAEEMRKALAKKEGAGKELADKKKQVEQPMPDNKLGFSAEEFKAWYHWDTESDPKNKAALKVEKALKKSMGAKGYKKFYDDMTDGYSARGHSKAFKGLESSLSSQNKETTKSTPKKETTSKTTTSPVDEGVFLKKYDSKEKAAIKKGIREARTSGKTLYITKDSDNQLSIGENTYGDNVVGTIHPNGKLYRGEVTSKNNSKSTNGTTTKSATSEDGETKSTKKREVETKTPTFKALLSKGWERVHHNGSYYVASPDGKEAYKLNSDKFQLSIPEGAKRITPPKEVSDWMAVHRELNADNLTRTSKKNAGTPMATTYTQYMELAKRAKSSKEKQAISEDFDKHYAPAGFRKIQGKNIELLDTPENKKKIERLLKLRDKGEYEVDSFYRGGNRKQPATYQFWYAGGYDRRNPSREWREHDTHLDRSYRIRTAEQSKTKRTTKKKK